MINGNKYNIYQIVTANPPNLYGKILQMYLESETTDTRRNEQKKVKLQLLSVEQIHGNREHVHVHCTKSLSAMKKLSIKL